MIFFEAWSLVLGAISDAQGLSWDELVYRRDSQVVKAAVFIAAVFFITLLFRWWRKRKSGSHYHTGLLIDKHHSPGIAYKLIRGLTWGLVAVSIIFLGIALADPVVVTTNVSEQIESREVVYLYDVSASNGFHLPNSKVPRGQLARETINKIILKRKESNDRAAYVVFATQSEIWSGFTTSYDSLSFSVAMSPIAIAPPNAPQLWPQFFVLKPGQYVALIDGGATNLHLGLDSAIYLFEKRGSPKVTEELENDPNAKRRSVIIITDGAADKDPEPQFRELGKRHIIPYMIFVDLDRTPEKNIHGPESPKSQLPENLFAMVRRYRGQYFLAKDRQAIEHISEEIDKLQGVKLTKMVHTKENEVYFVPLAISFLLMVATVVIRGLFFWIWRTV